VGGYAFKKGQVPAFLVFCEGDGVAKRFHLHIVAKRPDGVSFEKYCAVFFKVSRKLDWVYDQIAILPISDPGYKCEINKVIGYSSKLGPESFIPAASFTR
jgi:hypothetical protein